jgi:16S rRNA processing protein RimM
VVGLVRGVHGLRGMLRVEPLTDNPARFEIGSMLHREGSDEPLTVVSAHPDGRGLLVRFAEVKDRPAADRLRQAYLEADPDASLPDTSYYWHEIIGCPVTTEEGVELGTVNDIFRVGESEVYVVHGPRGEIMIPAVSPLITELAPRERRIVVDAAALGLDG